MWLIGINKNLQNDIRAEAAVQADVTASKLSVRERVLNAFKEHWNYNPSGWNIFFDIYNAARSFVKTRQIAHIVKTALREKKLNSLAQVIGKVEAWRAQGLAPDTIQNELTKDQTLTTSFKGNEFGLLSHSSRSLLHNPKYINSHTWTTAKQIIREETMTASLGPQNWSYLNKISDSALKKAEAYYSGRTQIPPKGKDAEVIKLAHRELSKDPTLLNVLPKRIRNFFRATQTSPIALLENHKAYPQIKPFLTNPNDSENRVDAHFALRLHPDLLNLLPKERRPVLENTKNSPEIVEKVDSECKKMLEVHTRSFSAISEKDLLVAEKYYTNPSNPVPNLATATTLIQTHKALKKRPELLNLMSPVQKAFIQNTQNSPLVLTALKIAEHPEGESVLPLLHLSKQSLDEIENFFKDSDNNPMKLQNAKVLIDAFVAFEKDKDLVKLLPENLQTFVQNRNSAPQFLEAIHYISETSASERLLAPVLLYSSNSIEKLINYSSHEDDQVLFHAYLVWKSAPAQLPPYLQDFFESKDQDPNFIQDINVFMQNEVLKQDPDFTSVTSAMARDVHKIQSAPDREVLHEVAGYNDLVSNTEVSFDFHGKIVQIASNKTDEIRDIIKGVDNTASEKAKKRNLVLQHLVWNGNRNMILTYSNGVQGLSQKDREPVFTLQNSKNFVHIEQEDENSFLVTNLCNGVITTDQSVNQPGTPLKIVFQYRMTWNEQTNLWEVQGPFPAVRRGPQGQI